jgi:hypothetical protein
MQDIYAQPQLNSSTASGAKGASFLRTQNHELTRILRFKRSIRCRQLCGCPQALLGNV